MNGPPQKPTTACSGASSPRTMRIASSSRGERLVRVGHAQALDVCERAHRLGDDRPDALDEVDVEAHAEDRRHDVREHHRSVDAVPAHGLERDLRAELRCLRDLPERVALPDRAVLGQRPSGLPHEPHGRALDRLAPGGADEERLHPRLG